MWSFHPQNFCLQLLGSVRIWRHINISRLCSSCHPSSRFFRFSCYLFVFALNFFTCQTDVLAPFSENQLSSRALSLFLSIVRSVVQSWEKWHAWWRWTDIKTSPGYLTRKRQKTIHFKIQDGYQAKNKSKIILFRLQFRKNSKYPLFRFAVWLPNTLRRNPPGHWVILICSGQKSCTRIIKSIIAMFFTFFKG